MQLNLVNRFNGYFSNHFFCSSTSKYASKILPADVACAGKRLKETDWNEQAYQLKVKKFGLTVEKEAKLKAKQIRFLMYRGFEMDAIIKAITRKEDDI